MAKLPMVKCLICGEQFHREDVEFVKIKNRYAHKSCYEAQEAAKTEEERERDALNEYIKRLFNISTLTVKINRQVKDYVTERGYSYKGIRLTLIYWFEIKGNSIEKANGGIGIVPYTYEQALAYWKAIQDAQERNRQVVIEEIATPVREIKISSPQRKPMRHLKNLFGFLEER